MAFVFKTSRPNNLNRTLNDIGPGQYLSQKPFITVSKEMSKPFMSNTGRVDFTKKQNETPGPGTYYHDTNFEYMAKLLNTSQDKKREPFYRSLDYENSLTEPFNFVMKDDKQDSLGFMAKDKRFKYNKKDINNPGPGSYVLDSQFKMNKTTRPGLTKLGSKKEFNNSLIAQSPQKVVSIPSRAQCFGYEINQDNSAIMNDDPERTKKYGGLKFDSVGPGQYDVFSTKDWVNNNKGTSWSKSKTTKTDFTAFKLNKSDDLINSINERNFKKNEETKERRMKNKENVYKQLKIKNEMRKQNAINIKQKNNNLEKVMINVIYLSNLFIGNSRAWVLL